MNSEQLLELLAKNGEMKAQEFLAHVPRPRGDYVDFYSVAALLHANYIRSNSTLDHSGEKFQGQFGVNMRDTSVVLCQLMLPPGESFEINKCPRESWHDSDITLFITSEGYLRLDELQKRRQEKRQTRNGYWVAVGVAILAAVLSTSLSHYFALQRLAVERATTKPVAVAPK
jgi:hypothetical protein